MKKFTAVVLAAVALFAFVNLRAEDAKKDGKAIVFYRNGKLSAEKTTLVERIGEHFKLDRKGMAEEMEKRKQIIASAEPEYFGFFNRVQREFYGGG